MKEKKSLSVIEVIIIMAFFGMLASVESLLSSAEYGKQGYEQMTGMLSSLPNNTVLSENYFIVMFSIFSVISLIIFLFIFISGLKKKIPDRKGCLVVLSIIVLILGITVYSQIIGLITLICVLTVKGTKKKKDAKKDIPKISYSPDKYLPGIKGIGLCLALLAIYFSQLHFSDYLPKDKNVVRLISIGFDLLMMVLCLIVFRKEISNGFKKFRENIKPYLGFCLKNYAVFWIIYLLAAIASVYITHKNTSINQSLLEQLPLWYLIPAAIIYAPIVEEVLFRGCIRRLFGKNNILFIIISGALFGWLHAMSEVGLVNIIATSLPYAVLGGCFAYVYTKSNNITCNMFLHFCHNTLAVLMMILMRLF